VGSGKESSSAPLPCERRNRVEEAPRLIRELHVETPPFGRTSGTPTALCMRGQPPTWLTLHHCRLFISGDSTARAKNFSCHQPRAAANRMLRSCGCSRPSWTLAGSRAVGKSRQKPAGGLDAFLTALPRTASGTGVWPQLTPPRAGNAVRMGGARGGEPPRPAPPTRRAWLHGVSAAPRRAVDCHCRGCTGLCAAAGGAPWWVWEGGGGGGGGGGGHFPDAGWRGRGAGAADGRLRRAAARRLGETYHPPAAATSTPRGAAPRPSAPRLFAAVDATYVRYVGWRRRIPRPRRVRLGPGGRAARAPGRGWACVVGARPGVRGVPPLWRGCPRL